MQILSGKLTAKQEFYQREPVRQGFDKNLSPHTAYGRVLCTNKLTVDSIERKRRFHITLPSVSLAILVLVVVLVMLVVVLVVLVIVLR